MNYSVLPYSRERGSAMSKSRIRKQRGTGLVEAAVTLPVLLTMLFGIMDFGRALFAYNDITYAAREGTRFAMVHGSTSQHAASATDVQSIVSNYTDGLDPNALSVITTWSPDNKPGSNVTVQVQYTFTPMTPFFSTMPIALGASSQMMIAQ